MAVPDGIRLVLQPAHSPELQPAEHLWEFVDEPLANQCFKTIESLDEAVGHRCIAIILGTPKKAPDEMPGAFRQKLDTACCCPAVRTYSSDRRERCCL
jgi:hypothetical protein